MGTSEETAAARLVRRHRVEAGLTQRDLADRSGVSERTIRGLETGRIGTPHLTTLVTLGEAVGLGHADVDALVRAFTGGGPIRPLMPDLLQQGVDVGQLLRDARVREQSELRLLSTTRRDVVGPDRLVAFRESTHVYEALVDGVDGFLLVDTGDQATDVHLLGIEDTWGCAVERTTVLDSITAVAFEMSFGSALRAGESRACGFVLAHPTGCPEDPDLARRWRALTDSDGVSASFRRGGFPHTHAVTFHPEQLPARVWEARGLDFRKTRELALDPYGTVHLHIPATVHDSYTITWSWDERVGPGEVS